MSEPANRLVVVNMATWPKDFTDFQMYCCPASEEGFRPEYRHYPAKYIANYVHKGAKYIGVVAACVKLYKDGRNEVLWKFEDISDAEACARAEEVRAATRRNLRPCLVFLQSQLSMTDFEYDHPGGLQGSRVYFDVTLLAPSDVKDLAQKLRNEKWSTVPKLQVKD